MFKSRLPQIAAQLDDRIDAGLQVGAKIIAQAARERVPRNTGALHDAIHEEKTADGEWAVIAGDTEAFYGHLVEFGTSHTAARPFLTPALEESQGEVLKALNAALRGL
jgi:HK97 gp10 family phage protein